jgi:hypothetical protein
MFSWFSSLGGCYHNIEFPFYSSQHAVWFPPHLLPCPFNRSEAAIHNKSIGGLGLICNKDKVTEELEMLRE